MILIPVLVLHHSPRNYAEDIHAADPGRHERRRAIKLAADVLPRLMLNIFQACRINGAPLSTVPKRMPVRQVRDTADDVDAIRSPGRGMEKSPPRFSGPECGFQSLPSQ